MVDAAALLCHRWFRDACSTVDLLCYPCLLVLTCISPWLCCSASLMCERTKGGTILQASAGGGSHLVKSILEIAGRHICAGQVHHGLNAHLQARAQVTM